MRARIQGMVHVPCCTSRPSLFKRLDRANWSPSDSACLKRGSGGRISSRDDPVPVTNPQAMVGNDNHRLPFVSQDARSFKKERALNGPPSGSRSSDVTDAPLRPRFLSSFWNIDSALSSPSVHIDGGQLFGLPWLFCGSGSRREFPSAQASKARVIVW